MRCISNFALDLCSCVRRRNIMNEFLNDPVALGTVIFAVLINLAVIGLKWQMSSNEGATLCEGNNE